MRRAAPTLPVSPAMLRHFAVLTVVITVCIAIFAQGENGSLEEAKRLAASRQGSAGAFSVKSSASQAQANKQAQAGQPVREQNGLKIASGTRLQDNSADESADHVDRVAATDAQGLDNSQTRTLADEGLVADPVAGAPPMVKDPRGIPAPSVTAALSKQPRPGKPQPPRRPTQADYDRMIAAAQQSAGPATSDE